MHNKLNLHSHFYLHFYSGKLALIYTLTHTLTYNLTQTLNHTLTHILTYNTPMCRAKICCCASIRLPFKSIALISSISFVGIYIYL